MLLCQTENLPDHPAIDAVDSYSKYLEYPEFIEYVSKTVSPGWVDNILKAKNILIRGREAYEQIYRRLQCLER